MSIALFELCLVLSVSFHNSPNDKNADTQIFTLPFLVLLEGIWGWEGKKSLKHTYEYDYDAEAKTSPMLFTLCTY